MAANLIPVTADGGFAQTSSSGQPPVPFVNETQVNTAISDVVGNAPSNLNTLKELADELANKANTSSLSSVATSGSYTDLTNQPSIPTVPTTVSSFTNDSGYLTSVGTISYNDLTDKPSIPSLTGYATESYVGTAIANLVDTAPTTLNTLNELAAALGDDANYATTITTALGNKADTSSLATVATSGSYADLSNKPSIPTTVSSFTNDAGYLTSVGSISYNDLTDTPTIPTVPSTVSSFTNDAGYLTSVGIISYNDLTDKPSIPTTVSSFTNDAGYLTSVGIISYNDLTDKPSIPTVPTTVSSFTNDAGFITDISSKQDTLVSGTNIKSINGTSLLGSGDITISSGGSAFTGTLEVPAGTTFTAPTDFNGSSSYWNSMMGNELRIHVLGTFGTTNATMDALDTLVGGDSLIIEDGSGNTATVTLPSGGWANARSYSSGGGGSPYYEWRCSTTTTNPNNFSRFSTLASFTISGGTRTWTFNSAGNLQLPAGGTIVDNAGASVIPVDISELTDTTRLLGISMISGTFTMGYGAMGGIWEASRGSISITPTGILDDIGYNPSGDSTIVYLTAGTVGDYTIDSNGINGNTTLSVTIDGVTQTSSDLAVQGGVVVWVFVGNPFTLDNTNLHSVRMSPGSTISFNSLTDKPTLFSGNYSDLSGKPTIPTNTNQLTNGAGFLVSSDISGKQNTLVSGTSIRTVNGFSLLASGNLNVQAELVSGTNIKSINNTTLLGSGNLAVQAELVSGTNIKSINGTSLLGSGDITISGGSGSGPTDYFKGLQILEDVYEASGAANIIFESSDSSVSITRNANALDFTVVAGGGASLGDLTVTDSTISTSKLTTYTSLDWTSIMWWSSNSIYIIGAHAGFNAVIKSIELYSPIHINDVSYTIQTINWTDSSGFISTTSSIPNETVTSIKLMDSIVKISNLLVTNISGGTYGTQVKLFDDKVAIGLNAGGSTQGAGAVAVGYSAGAGQSYDAVAIGSQAGSSQQGSNAVAIGKGAGQNSQHANSIVLNATGSMLNTDGADRFYVKPVRSATTSNVIYYNSTTGEMTYGAAPSGGDNGGGGSSGIDATAFSYSSIPAYYMNNETNMPYTPPAATGTKLMLLNGPPWINVISAGSMSQLTPTFGSISPPWASWWYGTVTAGTNFATLQTSGSGNANYVGFTLDSSTNPATSSCYVGAIPVMIDASTGVASTSSPYDGMGWTPTSPGYAYFTLYASPNGGGTNPTEFTPAAGVTSYFNIDESVTYVRAPASVWANGGTGGTLGTLTGLDPMANYNAMARGIFFGV